ncbi:MAG TPA: hypothetical protein VJU58_02825 [Microbacterium sp.]|nr:hypothetical protein [Microbacterium sp.]
MPRLTTVDETVRVARAGATSDEPSRGSGVFDSEMYNGQPARSTP